jgi:hypothetical protein
MPTPFTLAGTLQVPPDAGQPNAPISFGVSGQFNSNLETVLTLLGTGTKELDLGTIPDAGLRGLLIKVDATGPTPGTPPNPVLIRLNGAGAAGEEEISPGGFKALGSPNPVAGITTITIIYTSDVRVRVWAYG